jgi:large subunit ribosomal protein L22
MEATAHVRHIRMSPRKLRPVANMVRGEPVEHAMATLQLMPKRAARILAKALVSATANAEDRSGGEVEIESLYVKHVNIDQGPIIKRWMARAMGRANRIQHRTSHVTIVVSDGA